MAKGGKNRGGGGGGRQAKGPAKGKEKLQICDNAGDDGVVGERQAKVKDKVGDAESGKNKRAAKWRDKLDIDNAGGDGGLGERQAKVKDKVGDADSGKNKRAAKLRDKLDIDNAGGDGGVGERQAKVKDKVGDADSGNDKGKDNLDICDGGVCDTDPGNGGKLKGSKDQKKAKVVHGDTDPDDGRKPKGGKDQKKPKGKDKVDVGDTCQKLENKDKIQKLSDDSIQNEPDEQDQETANNAKLVAEALIEQEKAAYRLPDQKTMKDLEVFNLTTKLTHSELTEFYEKQHEYNRATYHYTMEVVREDGSRYYVPVTPEKGATIEQRRHVLVQFLRESDGAIFRALVEEHSRYVVAFQIVYEFDEDPMEIKGPPPQFYPKEDQDDPSKVNWFVFNGHEGLARRFHRTAPITYDCRYHHLEHVKFDKYTGINLCKFLESFRKNRKQPITAKGEIWFSTLFVLVSEAVRFFLVQMWITTTYGVIPRPLTNLIQCWLKLSKAPYYVQLFLLETSLLELFGDEDSALAVKKLEVEAKFHFARVQLKIKGCGLDFFPEVSKVEDKKVVFVDKNISIQDVNIDLNILQAVCGAQGLQLLLYDPKLCRRLQLRLCGYRGPV